MTAAITVDRDFARFGSKSYAINKINTVEVREIKPNGVLGVIVCGFLTFAMLMAAAGSAGSQDSGTGGMIVIATLFAGGTVLFWKRSRIIDYRLFLMTSSSEAQAFTSRDRDEVYDLRDSIEQAMAARA